MRRGVGRESNLVTSKVFNALDALLADHAIRAARPIHHEEGVRVYVLVLKLSEILSPDIGCCEHDIHVVGGESGGAFGPVVDDLEADLETFTVVNGARYRVESA